MTIRAAAEARAAGARDVTARPSQRRHAEWVDGTSPARVARAFDVRAATDNTGPIVATFASVTEQPYEMYDMFGPYTEVVSLDAFDATLATGPSVEFTLNHGAGGGIPMAHTRNATLTLSAIKDGDVVAGLVDHRLVPESGDVADMLKAMQRLDLAESSFKFRIDSGQWSPDWTEYRILAVSLDRGDVSAVNFGANPHTASDMLKHAAPTTVPATTPVAIADEDTARRVLITDADTRRRTA